jgi:hypothetical protein
MMALANLKVSRKLALGLACVLVVFDVTSIAFFFTLLTIDRASQEVAAATTHTKHVVQATSGIVDESQARTETAGRGSTQDAESALLISWQPPQSRRSNRAAGRRGSDVMRPLPPNER